MRKALLAIALLLSSIGFAEILNGEDDSSGEEEISDDPINDKITALYMISSYGDYIGGGKNVVYFQGQDGKFTISNTNPYNVTVNFNSPLDYWIIDFSTPTGENLKRGIYKNAQRFPDDHTDAPGLSVHGCGRGCNTSAGEFEILEISFAENGQVESFAANFIQKCEVKFPALIGSIRFNSSIPLEVRFNDAFENTSETVLFLFKYSPKSENKTFLAKAWQAIEEPKLIDIPFLSEFKRNSEMKSAFLTDDECNFQIKSLPYGGEGIEISITDNFQEQWVLDFAAPLGENFQTDFYGTASRYPFHSSVYPGIDILTPEGTFTLKEGEFEILKLARSEDGKIEKLALNFIVQNEDKEIISGAIRIHSKFPLKLSCLDW